MMRHICLAAWVYVALAVGLGVAMATESIPTQTTSATDISTLVMQGGFGALVLAELARWRDLGAQLLRLLDSALTDLRDGRMTVRHEHVDVDGRPVERRRPSRGHGDEPG